MVEEKTAEQESLAPGSSRDDPQTQPLSEDAAAPRPLHESDPNGSGTDGLAGGMGVSSERQGPVRGTPGAVTHGTEDTSADDPGPPGSG